MFVPDSGSAGRMFSSMKSCCLLLICAVVTSCILLFWAECNEIWNKQETTDGPKWSSKALTGEFLHLLWSVLPPERRGCSVPCSLMSSLSLMSCCLWGFGLVLFGRVNRTAVIYMQRTSADVCGGTARCSGPIWSRSEGGAWAGWCAAIASSLPAAGAVMAALPPHLRQNTAGNPQPRKLHLCASCTLTYS